MTDRLLVDLAGEGQVSVSVWLSEEYLEPPGPSVPLGPQRAAAASTNPDAAEALAILGQDAPLGWQELYKIFEIVRDAVRPTPLDRSGLTTRAEISAFTASANRPDVSGAIARHARMSGNTPHQTMTLQEAREFISRVTGAWIDTLT